MNDFLSFFLGMAVMWLMLDGGFGVSLFSTVAAPIWQRVKTQFSRPRAVVYVVVAAPPEQPERLPKQVAHLRLVPSNTLVSASSRPGKGTR